MVMMVRFIDLDCIKGDTNSCLYLGSLLTGIVAMKQFQNVFHSGTTGPTVSVLFSLYTVLVHPKFGEIFNR